MDRSAEFIQACRDVARAIGRSEACVEWTPGASLLPSVSERPAFYQQTANLHAHITFIQGFIQEHRKDYIFPGRCSEADKDAIEAEISGLVKAASAAIDALSKALAAVKPGKPPALGASQIAHYHGAVLILTTLLAAVTATFSQAQAARHSLQRPAHAQSAATPPSLRAVVQAAKAGPLGASPDGGLRHRHPPPSSQNAHNGAHLAQESPELVVREPPPQQAQLQEQLPAEHLALAEELAARYEQTENIERSMLEVSSLNRAFAAHVLSQTEQIKMLYNQAVAATNHISMGNVQLAKTAEVNKSSGWTMFFLLVGAGVLLLFFDWQAG